MTEPDLGSWQRLAPLALVFLIVNGLQKAVRENLFLFAGAGAGFAFLDWLGPRELLLVGAAILLTTLVSAIIFHHRFSFRLDDDAVRVRRGLLEKKELRIRFARVQNIQLSQPFYFRPFGLVHLSLETPGAAQAEVELPGISRSLAEHMRDRIVGAQRAKSVEETSTEPVAAPEPRELFVAGRGRLFVHGMSSNQVWLLAGALAWLTGVLVDRLGFDSGKSVFFQWVSGQDPIPWLLIPAALIVLLVILILLSGLISVIRYHGFRLHDRGERVVGIGGLLDEREQTVRRDKLTGLTLKQTAWGRLFGSWYLVIRQTRSAEHEEAERKGGFLVPGLRCSDHGLVGSLIPGWQVPTEFSGISRHFRPYLWLRIFVLFSLVFGFLFWGNGSEHFLTRISVVVMVVLLGATHLRWRRWGWCLENSRLWVRQGLLGQSLDGFELNQVQQVGLTQNPFQRSNKLASVQFVLPQGSVTIPFLPQDDAAELANRALYAAETSGMHRV